MTVYISTLALTMFLVAVVPKLRVGKTLLFERYRKLSILICCLPLIYVASIRYDVGKDYLNYLDLYLRIKNGTNQFPIEPLYNLLNKGLGLLDAPYPYIFAVCGLLFCVFTMAAIFEDSPDPVLSAFLLVCAGYYFVFFNAVRQLVAYAILLWAIKFIEKRKFIPFVITVVLAAGIHSSSIFFIIMYFIAKSLLNRKVIIIATIAVFLLSSPLSSFILRLMSLTSYAHYIGGHFDVESSGYTTLLINIVLVVFATVFYDDEDEQYKLYYNFLVIALWLSAFVGKVVLIARIRLMFSLPGIIAIPLVLNKAHNFREKHLIRVSIYIIYFIYFYYTIGINNSNNVLPFDTIFNHGF